MAALHLLAAQSTQLPRASTAVVSPSSRPPLPPPATEFTGLAVPVYPYARETPHPLLSGALRRGKWTPEEEAYAAAIIQYFLSGVLPIQYGTTLRGYIAQLLHCDPMRVSKKLIPGSVFVGVRIDPKIGRRSYYPCPVDTPGLDALKDQAERLLAQLRAAFIESIEREEEQEQAAMHPQHPVQRRASQGGSERHAAHSPVKRKRSDHEDHEDTAQPPPPPPPGHFHHARTPSLPSLTQLLWQNRQHGAPAPQHQHLPQPHTFFHYAQPPPPMYPQSHGGEPRVYEHHASVVDRSHSQSPVQ